MPTLVQPCGEDPGMRRIRRTNANVESEGSNLLAIPGPKTPVRRLNVDAFFCRSVDPGIAVSAARKHQRADFPVLDHADLKIAIGWSD